MSENISKMNDNVNSETCIIRTPTFYGHRSHFRHVEFSVVVSHFCGLADARVSAASFRDGAHDLP